MRISLAGGTCMPLDWGFWDMVFSFACAQLTNLAFELWESVSIIENMGVCQGPY